MISSSTNGFNFNLSQRNKITPRQLKRIDIMQLIRTNSTSELNSILNDLSQEDFSKNEYFDFTKDDLKLIKNYQVLTQYMLFSVNQLTQKGEKLRDLTDNQIQYNKNSEQAIKAKKNKVREQEEIINELTNDCANLEFLIKQLHLEGKVKEAGIDFDKFE